MTKNQKIEKENKAMNEMTTVEKEIKEMERKYSLYFNMKRKFDDLYRVTTTTFLIVITLCLYNLGETAFEILELLTR